MRAVVTDYQTGLLKQRCSVSSRMDSHELVILADDFLDQEGKRFPIGRIMKPSEVAEAVLFLVSPKAAAFSGTVIDLEQFPLGCLHHPMDTEPMQ